MPTVYNLIDSAIPLIPVYSNGGLISPNNLVYDDDTPFPKMR